MYSASSFDQSSCFENVTDAVGTTGLSTIPAKSLWSPSEESPPPLPLFQCCYNDVDFSFDIFLNLQNNIGQGVWGKKEATVQCYCLRLSERVM